MVEGNIRPPRQLPHRQPQIPPLRPVLAFEVTVVPAKPWEHQLQTAETQLFHLLLGLWEDNHDGKKHT